MSGYPGGPPGGYFGAAGNNMTGLPNMQGLPFQAPMQGQQTFGGNTNISAAHIARLTDFHDRQQAMAQPMPQQPVQAAANSAEMLQRLVAALPPQAQDIIRQKKLTSTQVITWLNSPQGQGARDLAMRQLGIGSQTSTSHSPAPRFPPQTGFPVSPAGMPMSAFQQAAPLSQVQPVPQASSLPSTMRPNQVHQSMTPPPSAPSPQASNQSRPSTAGAQPVGHAVSPPAAPSPAPSASSSAVKKEAAPVSTARPASKKPKPKAPKKPTSSAPAAVFGALEPLVRAASPAPPARATTPAAPPVPTMPITPAAPVPVITQPPLPAKAPEVRAPEVTRKPTPPPAPPPVPERRRRDLVMRGTMRNEVSSLMYGAGDVPDPDMDSIEYMEDLVVEFFKDLCRPVAPIRQNINALHQAVPLTEAVIRHRLASSPALRKYLDRFDTMTAMSVVIKRAKRVMQPNNADLVATVGKDFLELDEGAQGAAPKKRLGRPRKGEERGNKDKEPKERKKAGPPKGWKANLNPEQQARLKVLGYKRGPYKRKPMGSMPKSEPS